MGILDVVQPFFLHVKTYCAAYASYSQTNSKYFHCNGRLNAFNQYRLLDFIVFFFIWFCFMDILGVVDNLHFIYVQPRQYFPNTMGGLLVRHVFLCVIFILSEMNDDGKIPVSSTDPATFMARYPWKMLIDHIHQLSRQSSKIHSDQHTDILFHAKQSIWSYFCIKSSFSFHWLAHQRNQRIATKFNL